MGSSTRNRSEIDQRLVHLAADPTGVRVLTLLNERTAGAREVVEALGIELAAARRQLEEMHAAGLIEVATEGRRRGATEPRYRAVAVPLWHDDEWAAISVEERQPLIRWVVETIAIDAREAVEAGSFAARSDSHASRTISQVDEQGWDELTRIHNDALDAIFAVQAACAERLAESGEEAIPVFSALLCGELARPGSAADRQG